MMKEGKGEKNIRHKIVVIPYSFWQENSNTKLEIYPTSLVNRDRENLQSKAEDRNILVEDATKLRSQAVAITFEDIILCINVSVGSDILSVASTGLITYNA